jgi:hypothetical protein
MYEEIGLCSSIRQHHEKTLREARDQGLAKESSGEGLLVRATPLEMAEQLCRRLVRGVRIMDDALLLDAEPAWAGAINTVLVKKGVRVSELHWTIAWRQAGERRR